MAKTAIEASRGDTTFLIEPEKLFRVTDKAHPLYDPRVQWPVDEKLIASIETLGFKKNQFLILRKNGPHLEIVDGRQRHTAILEVNRRRVAKGLEPLKVPVALEKAKNDVEAAETMIITTFLRRDDDVITAAEAVTDYMQKFGKNAKEASVRFGLTTKTIGTYETLVQLSDAVKNAVRKGLIGAHDAVEAFSGMTREDQAKNLERVLASAPSRRTGKGGDAEEGEGGEGAPDAPKKNKKDSPIARLRLIYRSEAAIEALSKRERTFVEWLFGKANLVDMMEVHPALAEAIEGAKKAKKAKKEKAARAEKRAGKKGDEDEGSGANA